MKQFDALIATQKSQLSVKSHFLKKKISKNHPKLTFFKNPNFCEVFLDFFFGNGTLHRAEVFCMVIRTSKCSIEAIKRLSRMIFIFRHLMGGSVFSDPWKGGSNFVFDVKLNYKVVC